MDTVIKEWYVECRQRVLPDEPRYFGTFESRGDAEAELWVNQGSPLSYCDEGQHSVTCDIPDGARVLPATTTRVERIQWQARRAATRSAR